MADGADARLTLLAVGRGADPGPGEVPLYPLSDSRASAAIEGPSQVARAAVRSRRMESGTSSARGEELAQVAQPVFYRRRVTWVAVYSRSLDPVAETVGLIRTQVLVAGGIALAFALIGGYLVARALSRRVRRLQTAAEHVAAGDYAHPIEIDSDDELGELTRKFNEMAARLARVDQARRDFIANASHELRTPIFSLGGFVELLRDEDIDDETREEFLAAMGEQVERLQKLAVDLLDLSRLDAGSLELQPEDVDLAELARGVVGEFAPEVGRRRAEVELRVPEGGVDARCDPERVAQIVRILLDNALRHTPEGTNVTVTANRDNGAASIAVADDGPGIGPAAEGQVFERFYTADAVRGSGLGLAIAQELAARMRGNIDLRSRPGETIFTLALPAPGQDPSE